MRMSAQHRMDVVNEGGGGKDTLELPPTRPSGTGSRPPGTAASQYQRNNFRQTWSSIAPSLEILSPEEIQDQEMCDLDIEDFGSAGDLTDDDDAGSGSDGGNFLTPHGPKSREVTHTSSLFHVDDPGKVTVEAEGQNEGQDWERDSEMSASRQISLLEKDAESDVDSEEERDIMREIKNEITQQVKAEMKDELALMKIQIEKQSGANDQKDDDLKNVDPDLKIAILKMRKLDRILAKKEKREKEVKRDRILLQARLKKELADIKPEGRDDIKEVKSNTSKFLALTLPPSHNLGIRISERGELEEPDSPPVTPLFATQVPDDSARGRARTDDTQMHTRDDDLESIQTEDSHITSSTSAKSSKRGSKMKDRDGKQKGKSKDFIKRNIQLAADAGESVAMTDDEKKRISDLLADIDDIPDVPDSEGQLGVSGVLVPKPTKTAVKEKNQLQTKPKPALTLKKT